MFQSFEKYGCCHKHKQRPAVQETSKLITCLFCCADAASQQNTASPGKSHARSNQRLAVSYKEHRMTTNNEPAGHTASCSGDGGRPPAILCRMGPFGTVDSLTVRSSGYFRRFIHIRIAVQEHLRKQRGEKLRGNP